MNQIANPLAIILSGGALVLLGFCLVFAMVLRLIEAGFLVSFLAYACSVTGLFCGLLGVLQYQQRGRW